MNRLYRITPKVFLNGVELCDRSFGEYPLHYGEIPRRDFLKITNFDDAWNSNLLLCSRETTIFKRKYILGYLNFFETMRVSKKNFKSYVVKETLKTYKDEYYTITELAKLLPAIEFVSWCKDNNLNICPIK